MASLNTNVLIDLGNPVRPRYAVAAALVRKVVRRGEAVCTTRLNIAELRVGVERAADRANEEQRFRLATSPPLILQGDSVLA